MYDTQDMARRIKERVKFCGFNMKTMLFELDLGINIISHLAKGQVISSINLAKIADYLNCSVDYLLGRTDDPTFVPRKVVKEFPHTKKRPSDAYIAAFGGNVHVPEDEKTPKVAREIFEEARNEEDE